MQFWKPLVWLDYHKNAQEMKVDISECFSCKKALLWYQEKLVYPGTSTAPLPHDEMPPSVQTVYEEARNIFESSPRAAAALLRLTIQILCAHLGKEGDLNQAIGALVKEGLPVRVKKALDTVRVVGNHSVHPGQIEINDDRETAAALFALVNYVVERMISEPAKIDELFEALPEGARKAIHRRDGDELQEENPPGSPAA